ncbi:MAG: cysteine--tRNA ligase [bacterium]
MRLYNTYSRSKEEVKPLEQNKIKIYVCGPTVYDYIHIGNARPMIVFDVLRRFLRYRGYDVTYVMNITDIDDRIINRARQEGSSTEEITATYSAAFLADQEALGIERADVHPKATEHVAEIIELIGKLLQEGLAYELDGDIYYNVRKFKNYGKLSGKNIDDLIAGARVEVDERKHNPLDFALWKTKKPGEPAWDSPWGPGRPGWHIECSTMSMKYLGEHFDIHAGGVDLIFPHHENEIAQSEGATKNTFVNYWLHNGFLQIDGEKMAKSLGNFRTVKEVLQKYSGLVIRLFFLQKHYRSPVDFTAQGLESARSASERLHIFYDNLNKVVSGSQISSPEIKATDAQKRFLDRFESMKAALVEAMEDDLNTPVALARFFDIVRETNKLLTQNELSASDLSVLDFVRKELDQIDSFFGIIERADRQPLPDHSAKLIELLIDVRNELRARKLWALSDKIRDELGKLGVVVEDKPDKTVWRAH